MSRTDVLKTYERTPQLTHAEWNRLRNLLQDQPQFRFFGVPADKALLDKLDAHCAATYEEPKP